VKRTDTDTVVRDSTVRVCTCSNASQYVSPGQINDSKVRVSRSDKTECIFKKRVN